jgi:hypothetical protein
MTYILSDGNASEKYEDWEELCLAAENWYDYMDTNGLGFEFPRIDLVYIKEGDIDELNSSIRAWEEKIAQAAGHKPFAGHGNYFVSADSEMGLSLEVREE